MAGSSAAHLPPCPVTLGWSRYLQHNRHMRWDGMEWHGIEHPPSSQTQLLSHPMSPTKPSWTTLPQCHFPQKGIIESFKIFESNYSLTLGLNHVPKNVISASFKPLQGW